MPGQWVFPYTKVTAKMFKRKASKMMKANDHTISLIKRGLMPVPDWYWEPKS